MSESGRLHQGDGPSQGARRVGQVTMKALGFEQEGRRLTESLGVDPA